MFTKQDKNENRKVRHARVRVKVSGTSECPRLNVYRSNAAIYAQIIDDTKGVTLAAASSLDKDLEKQVAGKNKTEQARLVGEAIGQKAVKANVKTVRSAGLEF